MACLNRDGERALLHRPGASAEAFADAVEFTPALTAGCAWFHLANTFALSALRPRAGEMVAAAKRAGMSISIDTGWDARAEWLAVLGPCLPYADLLFANEDEARELTGIRDAAGAARMIQGPGRTRLSSNSARQGTSWCREPRQSPRQDSTCPL